MASFTLELVSPEKVLFSGEVASVSVPSIDGEMTVFAGHAAVMAVLKPGVVVVADGNGTATRLYVRGGFADVSGAAVTILAEQAILLSDLKPETIAGEIKNAEDDLADAKTGPAKASAQERVSQLRELQKALVN
jgi:F-type H+-transporting ATPase subunit epsilon